MQFRENQKEFRRKVGIGKNCQRKKKKLVCEEKLRGCGCKKEQWRVLDFRRELSSGVWVRHCWILPFLKKKKKINKVYIFIKFKLFFSIGYNLQTMTEFWVSQKRFYCEYCRVWLADTNSARQQHENGTRHKHNVAEKLKEMRLKAQGAKIEADELQRHLVQIDNVARKQYEQDVKAMAIQAETKLLSGLFGPNVTTTEPKAKKESAWNYDEKCGYYYHSSLRHYYDKKSGYYYGGDPPAWTKTPDIPENVYFENMTEIGLVNDGLDVSNMVQQSVEFEKFDKTENNQSKPVRLAKNPMAEIGGYKVPDLRNYGKGKDVVQRKLKGIQKKSRDWEKLPEEEKEARLRREAARLRVQKRTMASFGFQT
eukprot:TRINITY_DN5375_c0_g2_i2.p1 TRINITY_DN5375_c0_g2~~TRINITY_DN5375_c0_g2_i2.p1  ORF type:complete len:367 (-),score=56.59 TRINITY_DN5375_c0_g2_i2:760-1860(-)